MFTFLSSLGFHAVAEETTNLGRIDLALKADNGVFLFEFKVDAKEEAALMQIKEKKYYEKHLGNKPVYLIGMHFCSTERIGRYQFIAIRLGGTLMFISGSGKRHLISFRAPLSSFSFSKAQI
jgi:hypothetical protein